VGKLIESGITEIRTLYVNDLDRGPYISDTLRIDPTKTRLKRWSKNLSHDASRRAADQGCGREPVSNLFFNGERYDLSPVGRMKFTAAWPRGNHGSGVLSKEDIIEVMKTLIDIRNGNGHVTTSTTWAIAACAASVKWPENAFRIGLVRVERAVKERLTIAEANPSCRRR